MVAVRCLDTTQLHVMAREQRDRSHLRITVACKNIDPLNCWKGNKINSVRIVNFVFRAHGVYFSWSYENLQVLKLQGRLSLLLMFWRTSLKTCARCGSFKVQSSVNMLPFRIVTPPTSEYRPKTLYLQGFHRFLELGIGIFSEGRDLTPMYLSEIATFDNVNLKYFPLIFRRRDISYQPF